MKQIKWISRLCFVTLGGLLLMSCGDSGGGHNRSDSADSAQNLNLTKFDTSQSQMNTANMLMSLYSGSLFDAKASRQMARESADNQIKKTALHLAVAHEQLNEQMTQLAAAQQISLPAALTREQQARLNALRQTETAKSAENYIRQMVNDHKDALILLDQAKQSNNQHIATWADKTVSGIQALLDQATTTQSYLDSIPRGRALR